MVEGMKQIQIESSTALIDWLSDNHQSDESYLLVTRKKSEIEKYVSRDEVLDALLAYVWIDGRRFALDEGRTMQLICKRKQQKWTKSYRDRVERLQANGQLHQSGLTMIEHAKQNGTWLANQDVDELVCPDDLSHALSNHKGTEWWQNSAPSYQRNILRWLASAKRQETRQKRCDEIALACGKGQKIKNM